MDAFAGLLVAPLLTLVVIVAGAAVWRWCRAERIERMRDQARLQVVEGQLAAFRALLRIKSAEQNAHRQMTHADDASDYWVDSSGRR